jgi:malate synthase
MIAAGGNRYTEYLSGPGTSAWAPAGCFLAFGRADMSQDSAVAERGTVAPEGVRIVGPMQPGYEPILTTDALSFVAELERRFGPERERLMAHRTEIQVRIDDGWLPDFLPETKEIRDGDWAVAPIPADLQDRRVEITGPVDRKMIVNALNCGADVFMADFEDANSPTWSNNLDGQINLRDAIHRQIDFTDPKSGKAYRLDDTIATLLVRPRGWHLLEAHLLVDGKPVSGGLFDFGLFFFHNAKRLIENGTAPYFYLPKLENHLEAKLWNDVFVWSQNELGIPQGTIKATILIETIMAAFEMDEILYAMREHIAGLNCGRWDYIFSYIKKFRNRKDFLLPDRDQITMTRHFLQSYSLLLIKTCHRRKAFAMGGMAAQIPIKNDPEANEHALDKVRVDKEREVGNGHDGTWVAHPGLVGVAKEIFDRHMPGPNQLDRMREDVEVGQKDLLEVPDGTITEKGLRHNLNVGIQYVEAWLRGSGCVPIYNLMEDAATAEICRSQVWQWIKHGASITDGPEIDAALVRKFLDEELTGISESVGPEAFDQGEYQTAASLFGDMVTTTDFEDFLTLPAYDRLVRKTAG